MNHVAGLRIVGVSYSRALRRPMASHVAHLEIDLSGSRVRRTQTVRSGQPGRVGPSASPGSGWGREASMNTLSVLVRAATGIAVLWLLAACSTKNVVESDLHMKGAPDWVNEGTQILKTGDGRLFLGVGSAPPLGDLSLLFFFVVVCVCAVLVCVLFFFLFVVLF